MPARSTARSSCPARRRSGYIGLIDGPHTFLVKATDASGNEDTTPAIHVWTVDTADARHADHRPAGRPEQRRVRQLRPRGYRQPHRARWVRLPLPPRRRALGRLRRSEVLRRRRRRPAHLLGEGTRRGRQRRPDRGLLHVDGGQRRAGDDDRGRPDRDDHEHGRTLHLLRRGGRDVRVQARPGCVDRVHVARRLLRPRRGRRTPSRCGRPTPPATSTRAPPRVPGRSTSRPRRPSTPRRTRRPPARRQRSRSRRTSPAPSSSAPSNGATFSSCSSPVELSGLVAGLQEFRVRAKDTAGNVDGTPASVTWTVTPPPETTIDSVTPDDADFLTESTSVTFVFSADQADATFECALDGAVPTPCTSPMTYTGLAFGPHDFEVWAIGPVQNREPPPAEYGWEIGDLTPPVVIITSGPGAATEDTTPTFTFELEQPEPGVVLQCSLDGAEFAICESPKTYTEAEVALATGQVAGAHTFEVWGSSRTAGRRRPRRCTSSRSTTTPLPRPRSTPARRPRSRSTSSSPSVPVLQQRARRVVRVRARPGRRRPGPVELVRRAGARQHGRGLQRTRGRRAHPARARGRPEPERRPDPGELHVDRRRPADHDDHGRRAAAARDDREHERDVHVLRRPEPGHVRLHARRRPAADVRLAARADGPRRGRPLARGRGHEPLRARRGAGGALRVDDRPAGRQDRARDDDRLRPGVQHDRHDRDVHLLRHRQRVAARDAGLRVQARRRRVRELLLAGRADRRVGRRARLLRAGARRGRQRRRDSGQLRLDGHRAAGSEHARRRQRRHRGSAPRRRQRDPHLPVGDGGRLHDGREPREPAGAAGGLPPGRLGRLRHRQHGDLRHAGHRLRARQHRPGPPAPLRGRHLDRHHDPRRRSARRAGLRPGRQPVAVRGRSAARAGDDDPLRAGRGERERDGAVLLLLRRPVRHVRVLARRRPHVELVRVAAPGRGPAARATTSSSWPR